MSFIDNISQKINNINYGWDKPETCMAFIPGLSFALDIILVQHDVSISLHPNKEQEDRLERLCKWSLIGSLSQIAVAVTVLKAVATNPVLILLAAAVALVALAQFSYTFFKANTIQVVDFDEPRPYAGTCIVVQSLLSKIVTPRF